MQVVENIERYFPSVARRLCGVHTSQYLSKLALACDASDVWKEAGMELSPETFVSVQASVALGLIAAKRHGFAITAPAGHHAHPDRAGALCLVNTTAIVAQALLQLGKHIAIIDFDGHHGDGTEAWCRGREGVLFGSIYQKGAYPLDSDFMHAYEGEGVVRFPILSGSGDDVFLRALEALLARVRYFRPNHILVSAGFDGYCEDPLLNLNYSKQGYHEAGRRIASLGIPVSAVLEGGYSRAVPKCIRAFCDGVGGIPWSSAEEYTHSSPECKRDCEHMLISVA